MTLQLSDQYSQATVQPERKAQVVAAIFTASVAAFSQTPLADPVKQGQRIALANASVKNPAVQWQPFAWYVVSRPALNTVADITDSFVQTAVTAAFDNISQQVIPPT